MTQIWKGCWKDKEATRIQVSTFIHPSRISWYAMVCFHPTRNSCQAVRVPERLKTVVQAAS